MITFKKAFPDCRPVFSFVYPANIENYSVFNEINDWSVYLYQAFKMSRANSCTSGIVVGIKIFMLVKDL